MTLPTCYPLLSSSVTFLSLNPGPYSPPPLRTGMDTITFGAQDWHRALAIAHSGRACMFPAMDGGYTGLVTPALARSHVFDDVSWSSAYTFASQMTALQRENIQVEIGPPKR